MSDNSGMSRPGSLLVAASVNDIDPIKAWDNLLSAPEEHHYQNGRRYHMYKKGRYPIPNDEDEQSRELMKHQMLLELTGGKLFFAPIGDTPQRILDIGTGAGWWAIDVADEFPGTDILGTDLSAMQPDMVPPNVRFVIDDIEEPEWLNGSNWDLIHMRQVSGVLRDIEGVLAKCFSHTRPGGWIELQDLYLIPKCDDGTMKENDSLLGFYQLLHQAFVKGGMDLQRPRQLRRYLQKAGFTNVGCVVKKTPVGPWARGDHLQRIGDSMKYAIYDLLPGFVVSLELIQVSRVEAEVWFAKVRKSLEDNSIHRYLDTYFWYAQKPAES